VPLPETVPVRYTEEEAGYISVRPVVRQSFRLEELLDMILSVTGKNLERIRQILRSGTVVYHFYRYWWPGFDAESTELNSLLARFPDADPARPFRAEECTVVLLESGGEPPRHSLEVAREIASRRRWLIRPTFWSSLMGLAGSSPPLYREYSYVRRADLYAQKLSRAQQEELARNAARFAPRALRVQLSRLPAAARILYLCPRTR
jgi:hypothetical protein